MDEWMNGPLDEWVQVDGWINGWMKARGPLDEWVYHGWMDE